MRYGCIYNVDEKVSFYKSLLVVIQLILFSDNFTRPNKNNSRLCTANWAEVRIRYPEEFTIYEMNKSMDQ